MYDENSFKNYIFWLKVKRIFLMLIFSIIGCALGIVISQFLTDVLLLQLSKPVIIAISTIIFFSISLLLTVGTGKEIQEGYWKMAVLRKLTVISKKLDNLEKLNTEPAVPPSIKELAKKRSSETNKLEENSTTNNLEQDKTETKEN